MPQPRAAWRPTRGWLPDSAAKSAARGRGRSAPRELGEILVRLLHQQRGARGGAAAADSARLAFDQRVTRTPASANRQATAAPVMPPPTTATSTSSSRVNEGNRTCRAADLRPSQHTAPERDPTDAPGPSRPDRDRGRRGRHRRGGATADPGQRRGEEARRPGHSRGLARAGQVYDAVDKALALPAGTTQKSLGKADLQLPADAKGNPEGYLFPATYPIKEKSTPEQMLRFMVDTAGKKFDGAPIAAGASATP